MNYRISHASGVCNQVVADSEPSASDTDNIEPYPEESEVQTVVSKNHLRKAGLTNSIVDP